MTIYLITYNDGAQKAFSTREKMVEFVLADIHHFWETIPDRFKSLWKIEEEELVSEFLENNGIEDLFYISEVPFDDSTLSTWFY